MQNALQIWVAFLNKEPAFFLLPLRSGSKMFCMIFVDKNAYLVSQFLLLGGGNLIELELIVRVTILMWYRL